MDEGSVILFFDTAKSLSISASHRGHGAERGIYDIVLNVIIVKVWVFSELEVLKVALCGSICINSNSGGVFTLEETVYATRKSTLILHSPEFFIHLILAN